MNSHLPSPKRTIVANWRRIVTVCTGVPLLTIVVTALLNCPASGGDTVYVSNLGGSYVQKFTLGGSGSFFADTGMFNPQGLAVDAAGYLFVATTGITRSKSSARMGSVPSSQR